LSKTGANCRHSANTYSTMLESNANDVLQYHVKRTGVWGTVLQYHVFWDTYIFTTVVFVFWDTTWFSIVYQKNWIKIPY